MLIKYYVKRQLFYTRCFNIHVGLKCKEKNASWYFRDEYKKVDGLFNIFKKLPDKEKPFKINVKFICGRYQRVFDNEQETKNGAIQIELSPPSVSENGTVDCRK